MREIKYRAYDKMENKMRLVKSIHFGDDGSAKTILVYLIDGISSGYVHGESCELLQYTGLNDKNGKDIYEGDIVLGLNCLKAKIIHGFCGFELEWIDGKTDKIRRRKTEEIFHNTSIVFEVIGNIYENPELMES